MLPWTQRCSIALRTRTREHAVGRPSDLSVTRLEDDGLVAEADDAVLAVPEHRAGQHDTLHVRAESHQILDGVPVVYAHHVLLDDRPVVELAPTSLTPRSLARRYAAAPMNAGRKE